MRLKHDYPTLGKGKLCSLFGKGRSAIYDYSRRQETRNFSDDIIIQHVHAFRKAMPRLGTRKLHYLLVPQLQQHGIKLGRDQLFDLLDRHKLLIRQRKRKVITTDSRHWMHKYPNLVGTSVATRPEQLWVSDITYIRLTNQWGYLSLITDAYSRQIMGHCFRTDMSAQGCVDALQMALRNRSYPSANLMHHSDRGAQYCSAEYVKLLQDNQVSISMTENGDPYENALAERMNGIIKGEFNLYESRLGFEATKSLITTSINTYNRLRPHGSCDMLTPDVAHEKTGILKKTWKKYPWRTPGKKEVGSAPLKEQDHASFLPDQLKNPNFKTTKCTII